MTEERRHVRVELTAAVGVSAPGWSASGKATDISNSGMQVVAPIDGSGQWPEQVLVYLPDLDEEIRVPARVTHCTPNGSECVTGLQFEFENAAQTKLVDSFVRWVRERGILEPGQRANSRRLPRASCSISAVTTSRSDARIDRLEKAVKKAARKPKKGA